MLSKVSFMPSAVLLAATAASPVLADQVVKPASLADRICEASCLHPAEAVAYAAYLAPRAGIASRFRMQVKASGEGRRAWFLNSETDYRDQNCLSVRLSPEVAKVFQRRYDGLGIEEIFEGREIVVRGVAERVRIDFLNDGRPTGKYYYQTHVRVDDPSQMFITDSDVIF